jgi:hypothetical protein
MRICDFILVLLLLGTLDASKAWAQASPYCTKVQARAADDATLLMSPRLILQGVRFPQNGLINDGLTVGTGFQPRASLSVAPLDFYKGLGKMHVGAADCRRHEALVAVENLLGQGDDRARLSAARAQADFLRDRREDWRALSDRAARRLSERIITLVEFDYMRQRVEIVERKLVQLEGEIGRLEARRLPAPKGSASALTREYLKGEERFLRTQAHLRALEPWHVHVLAGAVPLAPVDWYGLVELSFNVGGLALSSRDVDARMQEIQKAPYEVGARVDRYRAQIAADIAEAKAELELVQRNLELVTSTRQTLEKSNAANIAHSKDTLFVDQISLESDRVFLTTFMQSAGALLEEHD